MAALNCFATFIWPARLRQSSCTASLLILLCTLVLSPTAQSLRPSFLQDDALLPSSSPVSEPLSSSVDSKPSDDHRPTFTLSAHRHSHRAAFASIGAAAEAAAAVPHDPTLLAFQHGIDAEDSRAATAAAAAAAAVAAAADSSLRQRSRGRRMIPALRVVRPTPQQ